MKLLLLAGLVYTSLGMQCVAKQDKDATFCEAITDQTDCQTTDGCEYVSCEENRNGQHCLKDLSCFWVSQAAGCVTDTGCSVAPTKAQCNIKVDSDGGPCGFNSDSGACEARTCAHSGKSKAWCQKYNGSGVLGPKCMFLSQQCWNLPGGQEAKTNAPNDKPDKKTKGAAHCTSDKASKRVKCMLKPDNQSDCEAVADDECKFVAAPTDPSPPTPGKCDVNGNTQAIKNKKCNRKKMCKVSGSNCVEKTCDDFAKNQFTCHFKAKKIALECVMDGAPCRAGSFSDADMIAKACSTSTMKRVCHAQVKDDASPRCEFNDDDNVCRDATEKTCGDSNRKECRALRSANSGQGCWWLGPELRCLDNTTADCAILGKDRCKKVKKFKTHFGLSCSLNRSNDQCYNGSVPCGEITGDGKYCVEHANCSWNGTLCVDYASNPVSANASDTCQGFNKKTCREWKNNCYWYQGFNNGAGLCVVQPGANMP